MDWLAAPAAFVGIVLLLLAGWVLHLRPDSAIHRALTLLLLARGILALLVWVDSRLLSLPNRLGVYLIIALPFAAANVAYLYWRRSNGTKKGVVPQVVTRTLLLVLWVTFELAYLLDHSLYLDQDLNDGPFTLFFPASLAGFALVGLAAALAWRRAEAPRERRGHFVVALAFLVEPAYETGFRLLTWADTSLLGLLHGMDLAIRVGMGLLVVTALATFAAPKHQGENGGMLISPEERTAAWLLGLSIVTGLVIYLGFQTFPPRTAAAMMWIMNAFWLLAMALGLTYAIIRYQVLESRRLMSFAIRQSTFAAIVGILFVVTSETLEVLIDVSDRTAAIGVAVALAAGFRLLQRMTGTLVQRFVPMADDPPDVRPYEVYRAALEGLLVDGEVTRRERQALDALVAKLRLDPEEARRLEEEVLVRFAAAA